MAQQVYKIAYQMRGY